MARESKELAPIAGARSPDAYEQKFMAGQGLVLYRDKRRAPGLVHLSFVFGGLVTGASLLASGSLLGLAIALPLLAMLWLLFSVLRVTVSAGAINVQLGLFGPEIPISAIESAQATRYDWKRFGGWGIRRGPDGAWMYNMPGDGGNAARIEWRDRKGRRRVTMIGTPRAAELVEQVKVARAALPAAPRAPALEPGEDDPSR